MKGSTIYSISRLELSLALAVVGLRQGVKYSELLILSQVEWGVKVSQFYGNQQIWGGVEPELSRYSSTYSLL